MAYLGEYEEVEFGFIGIATAVIGAGASYLSNRSKGKEARKMRKYEMKMAKMQIESEEKSERRARSAQRLDMLMKIKMMQIGGLDIKKILPLAIIGVGVIMILKSDKKIKGGM